MGQNLLSLVLIAVSAVGILGLEPRITLAQTESGNVEEEERLSEGEIRLRAEQFVDDLITDYGRRRAAAEPAKRSGRVTFRLPLRTKARAGIFYNGKLLYPGMKIQDIEAVLGVADEQVVSRGKGGWKPSDTVSVSYLFYSKGLTVTMPLIWLDQEINNSQEYFDKSEVFSFDFYDPSKDFGNALITPIGDFCKGKFTHAKFTTDAGMQLDERTNGYAMDRLLSLKNLKGSMRKGSHGSIDFSSYYGGSIKFERFSRYSRDTEYLWGLTIYAQ